MGTRSNFTFPDKGHIGSNDKIITCLLLKGSNDNIIIHVCLQLNDTGIHVNLIYMHVQYKQIGNDNLSR